MDARPRACRFEVHAHVVKAGARMRAAVAKKIITTKTT
jgi:hypothetical protein